MMAQDAGPRADAFLNAEVEAGRFQGAVVLARQDQILFRSGYGFANQEWLVPNSPTTKFRMGSVTNPCYLGREPTDPTATQATFCLAC
jgi:CubicO group peptidase (beta-lactamase class C family)